MKKILLLILLSVPTLFYAHGGEQHLTTNVVTNVIDTATGEILTHTEIDKLLPDTEAVVDEEVIHLLTIILGIVTFTLLTLNIIIGFLRWKKILPWKMQLHKWLAISIWIVAAIHGTLVLIF